MGVLDLVFPRDCLSCSKAGSYICFDCLNKLPSLQQVCPVCNKPAIDGMTHIKCKKPWSLDGMVVLWPYGGVIRKALLGLKYKFASELAEELAIHAVSYLGKRRAALPLKANLTPIPLYWYRQNWRGFNQAAEIGRMVSEKMEWKYVADLLVRGKATKPQTELKKEERKKNVRGVFKINSKYRKPKTDDPARKSYALSVAGGRPLIIFDDVYTTGSTIKEAAKVLKRNGSKQVWGLAIAK